MGRFSILSRKPNPAPEPAAVLAKEPKPVVTPATAREAIRFPGNDGGKSLAEMAQRDLEAALQLLAERARYITGASGAAIALRDGTQIVCRASAGPSAPELGAHLQINSGLSGESIRTRQILRCDNAETDARVNRESCRALGISSVVVMPLINEEDVNGVFELFSGRPNAFEERDIVALQRLAEMIQTAVQHSEAAKRTERELATPLQSAPPEDISEKNSPKAPNELATQEPEMLASSKNEAAPEIVSVAAEKLVEEPVLAPAEESPVVLSQEPAPLQSKVNKCQACGFPVSGGRVLCLDCEANQSTESSGAEFLSQFQTEESWISSHKYLIGIVVMVIATIIVLLRFR